MEFLTTATLALGIGMCQHMTDYCPDLPGKAEINVELVKFSERNSVHLSIMHLSDLNTVEDRGTEQYHLQYQFKLW